MSRVQGLGQNENNIPVKGHISGIISISKGHDRKKLKLTFKNSTIFTLAKSLFEVTPFQSKRESSSLLTRWS